eukprot:scaffold58288_cov15-Tisochrysis_lutea.AAC.1
MLASPAGAWCLSRGASSAVRIAYALPPHPPPTLHISFTHTHASLPHLRAPGAHPGAHSLQPGGLKDPPTPKPNTHTGKLASPAGAGAHPRAQHPLLLDC